jgi:hypothetical protein
MFAPFFCRHAALIKRALQDVSPEELQLLELILTKVGKHAESFAQNKTAPYLSLKVSHETRHD